jgi:phospholipase C
MLTLQKHGFLPDRVKRVTAGFAAALFASTSMSTPAQTSTGQPSTPIKHVIVIIGENWTFDSLFATYKPAQKGESVLNLLSKKIVKSDGSPGPNYGDALQYKAYNFKKYKFAPPKDTLLALLAASSLRGPQHALCLSSSWLYVRNAMRHSAQYYEREKI